MILYRKCYLFEGGDMELFPEVGQHIAVWGCDIYHWFFSYLFRSTVRVGDENPLGFWLEIDGNSMASRWGDVNCQTRWCGMGGHLTFQISKGHVFQGLPHYLGKVRMLGWCIWCIDFPTRLWRAIFGAHSNPLKLLMCICIYTHVYNECHVHRSIRARYPPVIPPDILAVQSVQSYLSVSVWQDRMSTVGYRWV